MYRNVEHFHFFTLNCRQTAQLRKCPLDEAPQTTLHDPTFMAWEPTDESKG
jgi:hypothetical protein